MQTILSFSVLLVVATTCLAETTQGYQKQIRPIAESCKDATKASDKDVESIVYLTKDFTPEGKCLAACVMQKVGMMNSNRELRPVEDMLGPYNALFADDPARLAKAQEILSSCRADALKVTPNEPCEVAYTAVMCSILKT